MLRKLFFLSVLPVVTASGCCQTLQRIEVWKHQTLCAPPAQPVVATSNPCGTPEPACSAPATCAAPAATCAAPVAENTCGAPLPQGAVITGYGPDRVVTQSDSGQQMPENVPVPQTEPDLVPPGSTVISDRVQENP
jgi:hypothetical protein